MEACGKKMNNYYRIKNGWKIIKKGINNKHHTNFKLLIVVLVEIIVSLLLLLILFVQKQLQNTVPRKLKKK